jgi:phosphoglycolate phosphatase-like HAD superfamily hydrolase
LKGAVFDWDGTLVDIDQREFHCINKALQAQGARTVDRSFYIQNFYRRPFEVGTGPRMVLDAALAGKKVEEAYETYRRLFADTVDRARLHTGALELLQVLKERRFKIGVATMRVNRSVVESELSSLEVERFVDVLLTREDLGFKRRLESLEEAMDKRVRLVSKALERLNLDPRDSFLVGDSWWDIRAGKQLGMKAVMVLTGFSSHNDFSSEKPDLTVKSLEDLEARVRRGEWPTLS